MPRPHPLSALVAVPALALCGAALAAPSDWRTFRGPQGTGVAPGSQPPAELAESNTRWKVAIPGLGHSSPIVLGERIYLLTSVETERKLEREDGADEPEEGDGGRRGRRGPAKPDSVHEFVVLALDRADGKTVWSTTVRSEVPHEGTHETGTFASGSPIADGEHVYAFFGSRGLYCLDLEGKVVWEQDLGDMATRRGFGEGASPALHGDTLVVPWDHEGDSFVVALDRKDGKERWRRSRDEDTTWTTPVFAQVGGKTQAIVAGTNACIAYDLATGEEIWRSPGLTVNVIPTPIVGHGMVYLTSGFRGSALQAIDLSKAKGKIDADSDAMVWSHDSRGTPYVPSPLLSGERLYVLNENDSIISCFDAKSGKQHYFYQRLDVGSVYASLVGGGGHLYVCSREGDVVTLADDAEFRVLNTSSLDEGIDATPAIVGDEIYVRTTKHLVCFAGKPKRDV